MTEEQAGWTSYREFDLRLKGWNEKERREWERARWQMFLLMQMHPNIKQNSKPKSPQDWIPFQWERKQEKRIAAPKRCRISKKEMNRLKTIFSETIDRSR